MNIHKFTVQGVDTNTYLYKDLQTNSTFIVDPAGELENLARKVKNDNLKVEWIIITHCHFDHVLALAEFWREFRCEILIEEVEYENLLDNKHNLSVFFGVEVLPKKYLSQISWRKVKDGDILRCGKQEFKIISTPGHTSGSICIFIEESSNKKLLFSGDTVFCDGFGRTDLPTGDYSVLVSSIKKIKKLPKDTVVFPGHGESCLLSNIEDILTT